MSEPAFDPKAYLAMGHGQEPVKAAAPAAPAPAPAPAPGPPPNPADDRDRRRSAGLEQVAAYRAAHPGDPRSDDQLLVAPYGGYELLNYPEGIRDVCMQRLAEARPAEGPRP